MPKVLAGSRSLAGLSGLAELGLGGVASRNCRTADLADLASVSLKSLWQDLAHSGVLFACFKGINQEVL